MSTWAAAAPDEFDAVETTGASWRTVARQDVETGHLNGTRYLSAAAYLDERFRDLVVEELFSDPHRAVPPSFGFDLGVVARHCLAAQRLVLARDVLLGLLIVTGLWRATAATIAWMILGIIFGAAASTLEPIRKRVSLRAIAQLVAALGAVLLLSFLVTHLTLATEVFTQPSTVFANVRESGRAVFTSWPFWLAVASFGVVVGFRLAMYQTLQRIAQDTQTTPEASGYYIGKRLQYIDRSQWGNVIVHGGRWPFLGAGSDNESWSIAIELRGLGTDGRPGEPVSIDPVRAHESLRQRLLDTYEQAHLHEGERIVGLVVQPCVIARGLRRVGDVLLDSETRHSSPICSADPDLMEEVIRHPQAGLRFYQRVTVETAEWARESTANRWTQVDPDQDVSVSAFVYLAIEGAMLYLECVPTVLPGIRPAYRAVDDLADREAADLLLRAVRNSLVTFPRDSALSVVHALRRLLPVLRLDSRIGRAEYVPETAAAHNYGARLSIREAASAAHLATYLQRLDTEKYTKLIELRVTTAIRDFLRAEGVQTSEYEAQISVVHNNGVMITGGTVTGAVAVGTGAEAQAAVTTP